MIASIIAFTTSFITIRVLLRSSWSKTLVAYEDERSMHRGIVPRFGGVGIVSGVALGWLFLGVDSWWLLLLLGICIATVSFFDDMYTLPVWVRLSTQFGMASIFTLTEFGIDKGFLVPLLILTIVWMVNLYNFMDGLDGLAGGMSVFGFVSFGLVAYLVAADVVMLKAAIVVVCATLAFLRWNLIPQKLFLGDVGSTTLGFMAAAFSFYGWREGMWPVWFPVVVFLPFVADATITLLKRLVNGENIFQAHNKHYYQRLTQMGWTQKQVRRAWYSAMAVSSLTAISLLNSGRLEQIIGLLIVGIALLSILIVIEIKWGQFIHKKGEFLGKNYSSNLEESGAQGSAVVTEKLSPSAALALTLESSSGMPK